MAGVVVGAVLGLVPGALLILIASGGNYVISRSEIWTFLVMSFFAVALAGAIVGAAFGAILTIISAAMGRLYRSL